MSPEAAVSRPRILVVDDPLDDPRYTTCFVCNEGMPSMKVGPVICWANDRTSQGDYNLWLVFAHPECIERVAHHEYDLDRQRGSLESS